VGFTDLDPRRLILEVTETAVVDDPVAAHRNLRTLADRGIRTAVDDFGTGHATFAYLKQLPVHVVKVDRAFVAGLGDQRQDDAIVAGVIGMAGALDAQCIAEGIETAGQRDRLLDLGCRYGQGWLFARPMQHEDLLAYLRVGPGHDRPGQAGAL